MLVWSLLPLLSWFGVMGGILPCPILSCAVLFSPCLSCPVLSCPVLSCPVLSFFVLPCPVLFCAVRCCPVMCCPVLSNPVLSWPVFCCPVLSSLVLLSPLFFCPFLVWSVLFCPGRVHVLPCPVPSCPVQFCFLWWWLPQTTADLLQCICVAKVRFLFWEELHNNVTGHIYHHTVALSPVPSKPRLTQTAVRAQCILTITIYVTEGVRQVTFINV